ncbi:hypothetical protein BV349_05475 [Pseudomonas syringae pv. actinidiae]|nr:hypothetical protein BV349_05475 [Pseudomonas syringae pv. actinidiae]
MRGAGAQGKLHASADVGIERLIPHPVSNLCPLLRTEPPADEYGGFAVDSLSRLAIGHRAFREPVAVVVILIRRRALHSPGFYPDHAFARQIAFACYACRVERHFPAEYAHLHAPGGFKPEQFANAGMASVADEIHGRLKAPADDFDGFLGLGNGLINSSERFLAVDQRSVGGWNRAEFAFLDEPARNNPGAVGVRECDGHCYVVEAGEWRFHERFVPYRS